MPFLSLYLCYISIVPVLGKLKAGILLIGGGGMTPKQALFIQEYLIDLNATRAAIAAGYSPKTAYSIGQRLLKHVEIQGALVSIHAPA